jgi:hypothetical protein
MTLSRPRRDGEDDSASPLVLGLFLAAAWLAPLVSNWRLAQAILAIGAPDMKKGSRNRPPTSP